MCVCFAFSSYYLSPRPPGSAGEGLFGISQCKGSPCALPYVSEMLSVLLMRRRRRRRRGCGVYADYSPRLTDCFVLLLAFVIWADPIFHISPYTLKSVCVCTRDLDKFETAGLVFFLVLICVGVGVFYLIVFWLPFEPPDYTPCRFRGEGCWVNEPLNCMCAAPSHPDVRVQQV